MSSTRLQRAIHRDHAYERQKILDSLAEDPSLQQRRTRISDCASHGRVYLEGDPPEAKLWVHRCGDRICPLCSKYRSSQVSRQIRALLCSGGVWRHITLTIQNFPAGSLAAALVHLRESFARLRRSDSWHGTVFGGTYTLEITRNEKDGSWHPHLHVLYRGTYWEKQDLTKCWDKASRGSPVCWITPAGDRHAFYLAKYAGKPTDLVKWPSNAICEYAHATHGTRMAQTFGNCHGIVVEDKDSHPEPPKVRHMINLETLRMQAKHGHGGARSLLRALCLKYPWMLDFAHDVCTPYPESYDPERGPPGDLVDAEVNHAARYCLHFSVPLPPKNLEMPVMTACKSEPSTGVSVQTLFELKKPRNH